MMGAISAYFSRTSQVLDSSKYVGVLDCHTPDSSLPVRVFYPACDKSDHSVKKSVSWFVYSLAYFIDGYVHFIFPKMRGNVVYRYLVWLLAFVLSLFMPMASVSLPMCKYDAVLPSDGKKLPLIVFSHGLTGSGEEQAMTFLYWVQQGFIVAAVHHCDGSSCKVPRPHLDSPLLYLHPNMQNYDVDFRPRQVRQRQLELHEVKQYMLCASPWKDIIDSSQVCAAGFSYGAATASLEVVTHPLDYAACILLDGWFHIEVGEGMDFPQETHDAGISIPTLFVGSAQFADRPGLAAATANLQHKQSSAHVLAKSKHQNFCDVGFWLPVWLLRRAGAVGECDFDATYASLLLLTKDFLHIHLKKTEAKK